MTATLTPQQRLIVATRVLSDARLKDVILSDAYSEKELRDECTVSEKEVADDDFWDEERLLRKERLLEFSGVDSDRE